MSRLTITRQQLLSLLHSGLWSYSADISLFAGQVVDWRAILQLAEEQTVTGVIYDAILSLPKEMQPDTGLLRQLHIRAVRIAQSHQLLNATLATLSTRLQAQGIHSVLLKGQGVALNYPNPIRRSCGDIDLYVGAKSYPHACSLLNEWGMLGDDAAESLQHLHFNYNGVHIELHRIAGTMPSYNKNNLFRIWSDELLQGNTCRTAEIDGTKITLPPVHFDAFYIFYHTFKHFVAVGVSLRQVSDWMLYLHTFAGEIDHDALLKDLKRFHLLRQWQILGLIAVRNLGLPQEEMPFFCSNANIIRKADVALSLILQNGNFGFYDPKRTKRPDGYLSAKINSFLSIHRRLWRSLTISPTYTLCYYGSFLFRGFAQIYNDKFSHKKITGMTV